MATESSKQIQTGKYIFTQIDNLRSFTDTPSSQVKKPIKYIRMTIVEPHPI